MSNNQLLDKIYTNASKLRKENNDYNLSKCVNLRHDSQIISQLIFDYLVNEITYRISKTNNFNNHKTFIISNIHKRITKAVIIDFSKFKTKYSFRTFFTGFYDRTHKTYDKYLWDKAGIGLMTDEVNKLFFGTGIYIKDISDSSISSNHVIKVYIPPKPKY